MHRELPKGRRKERLATLVAEAQETHEPPRKQPPRARQARAWRDLPRLNETAPAPGPAELGEEPSAAAATPQRHP